MTKDLYATSSFDNLNLENLTDCIESDGNLDAVNVLFEYIFTTEQNLKSQNKYLILFLQNYLNQDIEVVKSFLLDDALEDLHVSLLKSVLIVTENVEELVEIRSKLLKIFSNKL